MVTNLELTNAAQVVGYWQPLICPKPGSEPQPFTVRGKRPPPSASSIARHRKQYGLAPAAPPAPKPRWRTVTADELREIATRRRSWREIAAELDCAEYQAKSRGGTLGVRIGHRQPPVSNEQLLEAWDRYRGQPAALKKTGIAVGLDHTSGSLGARVRRAIAKRELGT